MHAAYAFDLPVCATGGVKCAAGTRLIDPCLDACPGQGSLFYPFTSDTHLPLTHRLPSPLPYYHCSCSFDASLSVLVLASASVESCCADAARDFGRPPLPPHRRHPSHPTFQHLRQPTSQRRGHQWLPCDRRSWRRSTSTARGTEKVRPWPRDPVAAAGGPDPTSRRPRPPREGAYRWRKLEGQGDKVRERDPRLQSVQFATRSRSRWRATRHARAGRPVSSSRAPTFWMPSC